MQNDNLPLADDGLKISKQIFPLFRTGVNDLTSSVESEDQRLFRKTAKHDREPAIFQNMSRSFIAASGQIKIGNRFIIQTSEAIHSLWRKVDPSLIGGARR